MKTSWIPVLLIIMPFGAALVLDASKQRAQVQTNPSTLHQLCETEVEELKDSLDECQEAVARQSLHTEAAIAESSKGRHEANEEVQRLRAIIHKKEEELDELEAKNDKLHDRLISALDNLQPSNFAVVRIRQSPNMSQAAETAWMQCEEKKTQLELQVAQCRATLDAERSRQDMRKANHEELAENAEGNVRMLKEQIGLLDQQIVQAQRRHERLLRQVQQLEGITLLQQPTNASHSLLHSTPENGVGRKTGSEKVEAAKRLLKAAKSVRDEAAAEQQAAMARSQGRTAKARRSSDIADDARSDLKQLSGHISSQNDTLQRQREEAESAMERAAEAKAQAGILREEHAALSNASREAFMKAFMIDHERSQAKQAYKDAVVEARIASKRWEQEQHEKNLAAYNLTRLAAEQQRLEWRVATAEGAEAQAEVEAETAKKHLAEAEAQLKVEESRVRDAEKALEEARHGSKSSAAAHGSYWPSAFLAVALAAFLTHSLT